MLIQIAVWFPTALWRAVQALASHEGDATTVILRAVEEYVAAAAKRRGRRSGKYQKLVKALSTPVADLHLSARPASALQMLNIKYVYELVQKAPVDLFRLPNVGEKSLREVKDKLAALGLTLGIALDSAVYADAVMAAVVAGMQTARRGPACGA